MAGLRNAIARGKLHAFAEGFLARYRASGQNESAA